MSWGCADRECYLCCHAETSIYLASSPNVANMTSKYWDNCKAIQSDAATYDPEIAKKLWEVSEELVMPKLKAFL
eukprot:1147683-Pelagomonas_calceolata.AAC.3